MPNQIITFSTEYYPNLDNLNIGQKLTLNIYAEVISNRDGMIVLRTARVSVSDKSKMSTQAIVLSNLESINEKLADISNKQSDTKPVP